jgi:hypothetical protein
MCLEEWKKHGSTTGGYYKCNIFKDDPDGKKKINDEERDMKKLEFYLDRYAENKSAFKKTLEEIAEFKRAVFEKPSNNRSKLPYALCQEMPNIFDFYLEALRFVAKGRNFICYTFPLAYHIQNENELDLFAENQSQLGHALEALNKNLDDNKVKDFVVENNGKPMLSNTYASKKSKINELRNLLACQFINAEKEFESKAFLERIKTKGKVIVPVGNTKDTVKDPKKVAKKDAGGRVDSWYCDKCTYWNENNRGDTCSMCFQNGRPKGG